ncbi:MAG: hypothetical protein KAT62_10500 [Desulfuromonadales bacterium]|nr:hypothetical protein [Desulfuromonadales bacterium]
MDIINSKKCFLKKHLPEYICSKGFCKGFLWLILGIAGISVCIYTMLNFPGVPYNIRELFLGKGSLIHIALFSLAILWIGMSSVIIGQRVSINKCPYFSLPILVFLSGIISLVFLNFSVTEESISDIVGSSNIYWFVVNKRIWGEVGLKIFTYIDSPNTISSVERIIRYLALYSPVVFALSLFNAVLAGGSSISWFKRLTILLLCSLPWLFLCKVIAFDFSSTDNLNELIARDGAYGIGGGGFLYLLLMLISFNVALLGQVVRFGLSGKLLCVLITIASVPVGWFLLKNGLVVDFVKYGNRYSGVDFLLGPDRKNLLSQTELFIRWSFLQAGLVFVLVWGQNIVLKGFSSGSLQN